MRLGADAGAAVNRIRLVARERATNQELGRTVTDVDASAAEWQLSIDLKLPNAALTNVVVTIELLNVAGGVETAEWSGSATVTVSPGQTQSPATLELFRGPLGNLTITAVRISGAVASVIEGSTLQLSASAEGASSATQIFWGALDPTVATVSSSGAVQTLLPGRARIVAVAGPRADTVSITVLQRQAAVQVTPDLVTLAGLGAVGAFTARIVDPRGAPISGAGVNWSVADAGIAESLGNGQFRARGSGSTTVSAVSQNNPALRASTRLVVEQRTGSIELSPAERTLSSIGARQQYTAVARDESGNPMPGARFTWSSSVPAVATIDANGLATALSEGRTTIRVSSEGVSATATLTVAQGIALVQVTPAVDTLYAVGATTQFTARAFDGGANELRGRSFNWSSSNAAVASVDGSGRVTATGIGAATITAETGGVLATATIHVVQSLVRVDVTPRFASASALGERVQFNARARDRNNFPVSGKTPSWASANPAIATINESGLATVRGFGTVRITATIDGLVGEAELTVTRGTGSIVITPTNATLINPLDTLRLSAAVFDGAGVPVPSPAVTWTSFDISVATVSATGLVTAIGPGTVAIVARSGDATGTAIITVASRAPVATVSVTPSHATVATGRTLALSAVARDVNNNVIAAPAFSWTSSDPAKATVSASGLVNGIAAGSATITVSAGGRSASALINVYVPAANTIARHAGDAQTASVLTPVPSPLVVLVTDQIGAPFPGQNVQWVVTSGGGSVSVANVMTDAGGLASTQWTMGAAMGPQTIEARAPGLTGSPAIFTATAVAADVATVTVAPASRTLTAGDTATLTATAKNAAGVEQPGAVFAWTSSDTMVALVSGSGRVTARRAGTASIRATANGKTGTATITVNPGPAAVLLSYSGSGQAAAVSTTLRDSLVVQVVDIGGNPKSGVSVSWVVTSGGGSPGPASSVSGADGLARTSWTLGAALGPQSLEARVPGLIGSPVVFTASGSAPAGVRKTWIGGDAGSPNGWSVAANWSPAGAPSDRDTAYVPASPPNQPVLGGDVRVAALIVQIGATVNTSGYQIEVAQNVDASGAVTGVGKLLMTGAGATVRGTVSNLDVTGTVSAIGALVVTDALTIGVGDLKLNGQPVTVRGDLVAGTGTITMTNAADLLVVQGSMQLYAIDTNGKFSAGTIRLAGDFTLGCYNDTEFISTGTELVLNGSTPQNLSMACSGAAKSRLHKLTVSAGASVSTSDNPVFIASMLTVNGTFTILAGALVDVAGPSGSVVIAASGTLDNRGTLKANLPVAGTVTGNAAVQR